MGGTHAGRGDRHAIAHFFLFLVQNLHIDIDNNMQNMHTISGRRMQTWLH